MCLFDKTGTAVSTYQEEFEQIMPQPGWVEHDPLAILACVRNCVAKCCEGRDPAQIASVGITNQRETTVVWDRASGEPVCNAIVWQDRRTAATCDRLRADGALDIVRRKTGLVLDPYFSGTKIAWILDHVAGARARAVQ